MSIRITDEYLHRSLLWGLLVLGMSRVTLVGDPQVLLLDILTDSKILLISPFWVKTNIFDSLSGSILTPKNEKTLSLSPSLRVKSYPLSSSSLITY